MAAFDDGVGDVDAARVETLGEFSFMVAKGEAFWCCQWPKEERLALGLRMRQ